MTERLKGLKRYLLRTEGPCAYAAISEGSYKKFLDWIDKLAPGEALKYFNWRIAEMKRRIDD